MKGRLHARSTVLAALVLMIAWPLDTNAGGFAVFDQGAEAAGMGNAATAMSEAPATLFYNVGGAAFFSKQDASAGVLSTPSQSISFSEPLDTTVIQETFSQANPSPVLAHAYMIFPIAARLNAGVAVYSPFDLDTTHNNPTTFPGRATAVSSQIRTLDTNLSASARFGKLGIGIGVIARSSTFDLTRYLQTTSGTSTVDFASAAVTTDPQIGFGWNAGLLYQPSKKLAIGASYRSPISVTYNGSVTMTQILTGSTSLDEAFAAAFPFGTALPFNSKIDFPAVASAGVTMGLSKGLKASFDVNWTAWSALSQIAYTVTTVPLLDDTIPMNLVDSYSYRMGLQYTQFSGQKWRLGYSYDESPQPVSEMNAFLTDTHRQTVSVGWGMDWLDVSAQWVSHLARTSTNAAFEGTVAGDSWKIAVTVKKKPDKSKLEADAKDAAKKKLKL